MILINTIDANDMLIEAQLDDGIYHLGLSWNQEGQLWTLSIRDLNFAVLASGIAVVPNWPLLNQVRRPEFPEGEIAVYSVNDAKLVRKSFVNGEAAIFYFSPDEIAQTTNA